MTMLIDRPARLAGRPTTARTAIIDVDVVVPARNERAVLERNVRRLHRHLSEQARFSWRIVVADSASDDGTRTIAEALARELEGVAAIHVERPGRGRALRAAWSASDARVLCYMDADLSTDLRALLPLVAPLLSGHSDVAIGTRLARGARVVRGPRREAISRAYNRLLHVVLLARFSDAQCGFKALRAPVARELLPQVRDEGWFFDTELLMLAQRRGLRIHEVPVDWIEDADSRVRVVPTALEDLRGVARLAARGRIGRFAAVGVLSTLAYAALFLLLRGPLGAAAANVAALAVTAVGNTALNRRATFGVRGRCGLLREHALAGAVFVLGVALTSAALALLDALAADPSRLVELCVLVAASALATAVRYVALSRWVFAR